MLSEKHLLRAFEAILNVTGSAFGIAIAILIVLMNMDISVRFFGVGSLPWLIEIVEYVLAGGTFLAAAWVLRKGAHVRVDIFTSSLPARWRSRIDRFINFGGCAISGTLFYFGCVAVRDAWSAGEVLYKSLWVPEWIVLMPVPVGCLLLFCEFVLRLVRIHGIAPDDIDPVARGGI